MAMEQRILADVSLESSMKRKEKRYKQSAYDIAAEAAHAVMHAKQQKQGQRVLTKQYTHKTVAAGISKSKASESERDPSLLTKSVNLRSSLPDGVSDFFHFQPHNGIFNNVSNKNSEAG